MTLLAAPQSINIEPNPKHSTKVEHAPNMPINGMLESRKPKLEEIH